MFDHNPRVQMFWNKNKNNTSTNPCNVTDWHIIFSVAADEKD